MGMFDTVCIECPHCEGKHEEQTKSGDCLLECWDLDLAPEDLAYGVSDYPISCDECGEKFIVESARETMVKKYKEE